MLASEIEETIREGVGGELGKKLVVGNTST
jgi:hypothetical protein